MSDAWRNREVDEPHQITEAGNYSELLIDENGLLWVNLWESSLRVHRHHIQRIDRGERLPDRLSDIRRDLIPDNDVPESLNRGEGGDWMDAAATGRGLGALGDGVGGTWDKEHDCVEGRTRFCPLDISTGNMVIDVRRRQAGRGPPDNRCMPIVLSSQLNDRQLCAYDIVRAHKGGHGEREPPRMMMLGTAGTGKSWLVNALAHLLGCSIRRVAPTEMTAFLIGGSSLRSLLKRLLRAGRSLQRESLKKLQNYLRGVDYIVTDELGMVS